LSGAAARGVAVFASVGNRAQDHYQGLFTDSDGDTLHDFDVSLGRPRVDNAGETLNITLQPGETIRIFLQWNDAFGASGNDYDLCVYVPPDLPTSPLFCSDAIQNGNDDPTEFLPLINNGATPVMLGIAIINAQGRATPGIFDLFILGGTVGEFIVPESSVPNGGDAMGIISVGAVNWQTPETIEPFSSQGPTNDGRLKPELVAPDGVSVTGHGDFPTPFFGTSAAAPHAGAIGALILSVNPTLTPSLLASRLTTTAIPSGVPMPNNTFGFGRVDAVNAVPPRLVLSLNQTLFRAGETLRVGLRAQNPGAITSVDLYFGILLTDGVTVVFFNSVGDVVVTRLDADPRTFPPLLANTTLAPGLDTTLNDLFVYTFSTWEMPGVYVCFAVLTPPGVFADGKVDGSDLLTFPTAPFSFSP
jgi:subtilisin family serine protease